MTESSIDLLFSQDPLLLTKEDRSKIIEAYRNAQKNFRTPDEKAPKPAKQVKKKFDPALASIDLDLDGIL
jgi:DNA-binding SARP family transcriptional activator